MTIFVISLIVVLILFNFICLFASRNEYAIPDAPVRLIYTVLGIANITALFYFLISKFG